MSSLSNNVAIISSGVEILQGKIVDTNSSWIATCLEEKGFNISLIRVVGDNEDDLKNAILESSKSVQLIIITGGLGPTIDDRTRFAIADILQTSLKESKVAKNDIIRFFKKRGRTEIPKSNDIQTMIPDKSKIIRNKYGTAAGLFAKNNGVIIACFPGVPREMKSMFLEFVPSLDKSFPNRKKTFHKSISLFNMSESLFQEEYGDLLLSKNLEIGITAKSDRSLKIGIKGAKSAVLKHIVKVKKDCAEFILPKDTVLESVLSICEKKKLTLTTAESCTCGKVIASIGELSGASAILKEAYVTYANESKEGLLSVGSKTLKKYGAVSEEVAIEMAKGAALIAGANIAIATTGIAGPNGGTKNKPVGTVWTAIFYKNKVKTVKLQLVGSRIDIQNQTVAAVFTELLKIII